MSKENQASEHPGLELSRVLEECQIADAFVADRGGLSRPLISQITNGNRRITVNSASKICKVISNVLKLSDPRKDPMYWVKRQRDHDLWIQDQRITQAMNSGESGKVAG